MPFNEIYADNAGRYKLCCHAEKIPELEGWGELTPDMIEKGFNTLPNTLQTYVQYIEDQVDCPVSIISMGPQRHETIIR